MKINVNINMAGVPQEQQGLKPFRAQGLAAVSILLMLLMVSGCGHSDVHTISSMTVEKGPFEIAIPAFGELKSVKSTPIMVPPQVGGRQTITWMAEENTMVNAGDTVIRLDADYYNEQIQKENFEIAKLDLELKNKEQELFKEKHLLNGDITITSIEKEMAEVYKKRDPSIYSRNEIIEDEINLHYLDSKTRHYKTKKQKLDEKARAELQLLKLRRQTHQVKVDQYRAALDSLEIKAPNDGLFIYQKNWRGEAPRIGQTVWSGSRLGTLPDLDNMEAKIFVLESEAAGLKKDLKVSIVLDSNPGQDYSGTIVNVDSIAKALERNSPLKYFQVKVSLDNTDKQVMKPGSQVKATIFVARLEDVISVPNQALFFEQADGKEEAFVNIKTGSTFKKQKVITGTRGLARTVISEGLKEGDQILLGKPHDDEY